MAKKKANKKAATMSKGGVSRNPYAPFEDEIIFAVLKPKIDAVLADGVSSLEDLCKKFREKYASRISSGKMKDWCDALGYSFEKQVVVSGFIPSTGTSLSETDTPAIDDPDNVQSGPLEPATDADNDFGM